MSPTPRLSVIIPAYQAEGYLPRTLAAVCDSDLPRDQYELIVVDDASRDQTSAVAARWADRVVTLADRPGGPAHARNRGAVLARGEWLLFVDADVVVHRDTLRRVDQAFTAAPGLVAVFGTYDDAPPTPGFVSQFRNLMHRYVHLQSAGVADTFWAGCGAVRREAFLAVGGFDASRYPRPQIEDIELGYRLRDAGGEIRVDAAIQGAHLKRWTFVGGTRTDLVDRGIPWVRLLHERGGVTADKNLNLKGGERFKTSLVGLGLLLLGLVPWLGAPAALGALALLALVVALNWAVLHWFVRLRGPLFAVGAAGFLVWYHFISGVAVVLGTLAHWRGRLGRPARQAAKPDSPPRALTSVE
ncbi:MAG: glycosyltransferase family 2 protein [Gemmatimonadales bacterium]|nr:glycosyltransferase family 2 protein [Gemmatimonadales bacterium]